MTKDYYSDLPALDECEFQKRAVFVDIETSNWDNQISKGACALQIGAVIMELDGSISAEFEETICPTDEQMAVMSPGALQVNGFTEEILRAEGRPAEEVWGDFAKWLKDNKIVTTKHHYIGQNPKFDLAFINAEAPQISKKYGWVLHHPRVRNCMDLYSQAQSKWIVPYISDTRKGKNAKNLALQLQVEPEPDIHKAKEGALVNYRIYTRLAQVTRKWLNEHS